MPPKKRGRKRSKNPRRKKLQAKATVQEYNRIRLLARIYAGGNVSKWLIHGGVNAPRKYLK